MHNHDVARLNSIQAIIDLPPAVVDNSASREGVLFKCNASGLFWKKRWFVLDTEANQVVYYVDERKQVAKGVIRLKGAK